MVDTQRKDMVGCYGNPAVHTPHLDRLAAAGVRFERAYCCQPVCAAARSALFTGMHPHSNGVWANCMPLGATTHTVGERLADHGVHCAYVGKWHLDGGDYFGMGRAPPGWDPAYWYDMHNYLEELSPADRQRSRQTQTNADPNLAAEFTFAHRCSDRAVDFLARHAVEDFLLVVSYDEPHGPHLCPRPYSKMFADYAFPKSPNVADSLEDKPEHQQVWAGWAAALEVAEIKAPALLGCNAFVDAEIGRVIAAIDAHAPDALVVYTADHGDILHSHHLSNKGPAMYDEITNVPFIVRWPGRVPAGAVSPALLSQVHLTPTLLEIFGVPRPGVIEGHSLLPLWENPATPLDDVIFVEFGRYEVDHDGFGGFQPIRCALDARYKLVINLLTSDELYDRQADPGEGTNLIASTDPAHVAARDRLHDALLAWMNRTRDPFRGYYWERRPWRTDAAVPTWCYTGMTRQREEDEAYEPRQLDYKTGLPMDKATRHK